MSEDLIMKSVSSKQFERSEKKKRKLAALANIVQLNDQDRIAMAKEDRTRALSEEGLQSYAPQPSVSTTDDDGFVKVTYKNKTWKRITAAEEQLAYTSSDEPSNKRIKQKAEVSNGAVGNSSSKGIEIPRALSSDEYTDLRRKLRDRKRQLDDVPHLQLRELGQRALLETPQEQRTPVFLTDIQHLLMTALIGKNSPCTPDRWCFLQKSFKLSHSLVLIVEGMSLYHYLSHESKFEETNKIFETRLEVVLPPRKDGMIMEEMAQIPLTNIQAKDLIDKYGSLETAITMNKDPTLLVQSMFPMEKEEKIVKEHKVKNILPESDKFPRTKLLLSALQMVDEGYPMPLGGELKNRFRNYIFTKEKYQPVTDHSPMYGVDCEMCRTTTGMNELTRISIVNEQMETVYESLVRPNNKIIDYLTHFSGITPELMKTVTKDIKQVQTEVKALLPADAILVGQSLQFDLHAMHMMHPYVIDTSVCFNLTGVRKRKSKLQQLAMTFLKESIQENDDGHDSVEDSAACLKLVQMKLEHSLEFGDVILAEKRQQQEILRKSEEGAIRNNLFAHVSKRDKRTAIITAGELQKTTKDIINKADEVAEAIGDNLKSVNIFEFDSNKKAVKKAREIALEHALTITNLRINEENTTLDTMDLTIDKLDKWISKLWKTVAHNGLFLVLMGGSSECSNGVAKIAIKKNISDVVADVPLNV